MYIRYCGLELGHWLSLSGPASWWVREWGLKSDEQVSYSSVTKLNRRWLQSTTVKHKPTMAFNGALSKLALRSLMSGAGAAADEEGVWWVMSKWAPAVASRDSRRWLRCKASSQWVHTSVMACLPNKNIIQKLAWKCGSQFSSQSTHSSHSTAHLTSPFLSPVRSSQWHIWFSSASCHLWWASEPAAATVHLASIISPCCCGLVGHAFAWRTHAVCWIGGSAS